MRYWLPPILWMVAMFTASTNLGSFQHSSRFLAPVLRWLFPHITDESLGSVVFVIRKLAHLSEYAVLACLVWRAIRQPRRNETRPWSWPQMWAALLLVFLFAVSDETHQRFVSSREASVRDVLIDTAGALVGLLVLGALGRERGRQESVSAR